MAKVRNYVASLGLPLGFPIMEYNPADGVKGILADGCTEERIVDIVNNYLHQKAGLVQGRDELATYIETVLGFKMKTKQVTKGTGADAKTVEVADETEQKFLDRFVAALVKGEFTHPSITITGDNAEQREAQALAAVQKIVDKPYKLVTKDSEGKETTTVLFDLVNDAKAPERKVGVAKIPQYASKAAANIISDTLPDGSAKKTKLADRLKKWAATFTERGLAVEDFLSDAAKDATPEVKAAHEATRAERLARAIVLNEAWETAQNAKKYA